MHEVSSVEETNGFARDDCTLQYLLNCNEKRNLQVSAISIDEPGGMLLESLPQLSVPVLSSTPSRMPLNTLLYYIERY